MLAWPINRCRAGRLTPARIMSLPKVCRKRCGLAFWMVVKARWWRNRLRNPSLVMGWPRAFRAEVTLAVANGVYVILLLIGGVIFPLHELGSLASFARLLPTAALPLVLPTSR